jgi:Tol biopolymer transport system component
MVYVADGQLNLRRMAERESKPIPGTNVSPTNPVFSPDGKFIAFYANSDQTLKRVAVAGGLPETITTASNPYGMSWGAEDQIVFGQGAGGIRRVRGAGGTPETLVAGKTGELAHGPQILPGGDTLIYTLASLPANPAMWDNAKIMALSLKSNATKVLLEGGTDARYAPTGHLVYANAGRIMSVPFDATRLEVTGKPTALVQGLRNTGTTTGTAQFSFSNNGSLIYLSIAGTSGVSEFELAFVDMNGNRKPLRSIQGGAFGPRISPDGKQVAYRFGSSIWIADLTSNAPPRQLGTAEPQEAPVWSPDGQRIVFISIYNNNEALFVRRADGTGPAEMLVPIARAPESWSAVHDAVSFITLIGPSGDAGDYDISTYSFKEKKATPVIVIKPSAQSGSRFSPDGKWMAYESNESGRAEIFVEPYPRTGQRFQISKNGGARPVWAPDQSKLYFDDNVGNPMTRMYSVNIRTTPSFTSTEPQALPVAGFFQNRGTIRRQFDITPDGKQFLVMSQTTPIPMQIDIASNWFDELKKTR